MRRDRLDFNSSLHNTSFWVNLPARLALPPSVVNENLCSRYFIALPSSPHQVCAARDRSSQQRQYPFIVIISEREEWLINICWACQEFPSAFRGGLPSARRSRPYVLSFEEATSSSPYVSIKLRLVWGGASTHGLYKRGGHQGPTHVAKARQRGTINATVPRMQICFVSEDVGVWHQTDSRSNPEAAEPVGLLLHSSRSQHLPSAEETCDAGLSSASVVPAECHGLFISPVQLITEVVSFSIVLKYGEKFMKSYIMNGKIMLSGILLVFGGTFRNTIKTQRHPQFVEEPRAKFSIFQN